MDKNTENVEKIEDPEVEELKAVLKGDLPGTRVTVHLYKAIVPFGEQIDGFIIERTTAGFIFRLKATGELIPVPFSNYAGLRISKNKNNKEDIQDLHKVVTS